VLTTLRIKNLALVPDLTLDLEPGFNAITGETGAGKSIIIGALNLVLGERADRTLIRSGADSCTVEALFDVAKLRAPLAEFLETNGLEACADGQLVLKRTFTAAGANRQFINGSPTTLANLAAVGEWLVDMHGPHDHQSLLHAGRQLAILDAYGNLDSARAAFAELVKRRAEASAAKAALIVNEQTYARQLDLLRHQATEIEAARLQPGEDEAIAAEHSRASNSARLLELCQGALGLLGDDEGALPEQSAALGRALHELQKLDPGAGELVAAHEQIGEQLRELHTAVARYADRVDVDPDRLRELDERLNLLQTLKRKYGHTLDEVIAFGAEARRKLEQLEARDGEIERLNAELKKLDAQIERAGNELTAARKKLLPKLGREVAKHLADLGFKQSQFSVALSSVALNAFLQNPVTTGFDAVEFQFAPNPGEPARPLRAIASSGEMARVMLAIKTVLAAQDEIPVLVFDEVDANVGGETATAVGEKMNSIAGQRQVLCITHLPAVAAAAGTHYVVSKAVREGRTVSEIHALKKSERVEELARMLGGASKAARQHAEALLVGR
jgi:DNA repair protein RecN (Recombination protein N)